MILNPIKGGVDPSGATALAGDILYPKKAVLADGQLTEGTIPSQAAQTIYPSTVDQTIPAGIYLSGAQTIKGDANLVSANIAAGVSIFGVQGSYDPHASNTWGAKWTPGDSTKWTRTDNAANYSDPVPYVAGASTYGSPFDYFDPWKSMEIVEDAEAGTMVKLKKFWYKLTEEGTGGLYVQISDGPQTGFSVCPACADRGDGAGERDYVLIGRYHCGSSNWKSASGQTPKNNVTRSAARSSIHNLGSDIWLLDFATRFTIWLLYIVEYADWNSQAVIGYGCGNNSSVGTMGYTDSMPYHTGTTQSSNTTYGLGTQYRNIEGLWDNVRDWTGGCYNNDSGLNIILNLGTDSDSSNGTSIGTPTKGYPSKFAVTNAAGLPVSFIPSESSGSESTGSCDYWYFNTSSPTVSGGGFYVQAQTFGLFCFNGDGANSYGANFGARPMKLPSTT